VEAGHPLVANADLDCDGFPDTGDTNHDGRIDWHDVDGLTKDPKAECLDTVGPLGEPAPARRGEPGAWYAVVAPGGHPAAFTNPLILDRDGDGYRGVKP
jgi:hypothetical protein